VVLVYPGCGYRCDGHRPKPHCGCLRLPTRYRDGDHGYGLNVIELSSWFWHACWPLIVFADRMQSEYWLSCG